jgi:hypothetical protein
MCDYKGTVTEIKDNEPMCLRCGGNTCLQSGSALCFQDYTGTGDLTFTDFPTTKTTTMDWGASQEYYRGAALLEMHGYLQLQAEIDRLPSIPEPRTLYDWIPETYSIRFY